MAHFVTNGIKISYQQFGDGPDVVLIHGLAANRAFWFLHALQALKPECRVTIYDLRGHGYSSMPSRGYTTADMAEDLAGLMDHLEIPRAVLVGHSFGGVVGLQYATRHPGRVRGLVLADSRVHALQPAQRLEDQPELQPSEDALIADSTVDWQNEEHVGLRFLEEFARKRVNTGVLGNKHEFVPFGNNKKGDRSAKHWLKLLDTSTARDDFRSSAGLTVEKISSLRHPVVSIYGERSRCLESCMKLSERLDRCDTIIVPGVGHFHPITRPRYFNNAVLDFVEMVTTFDGSLEGEPRRITGHVRGDDRRSSHGNRVAWSGGERRAAWERRIPWRKRGWNGLERRESLRSRQLA